MITPLRSALLCFATLFMLSGCSTVDSAFDFLDDDKAPLEGERISVLELQKTLEPDDVEIAQAGLVMPAPWKNEFWPQAGGYPNHSMQNLALNEGPLTQIWRTDIGDGSSERLPLTAQPIIVDGQAFTLDTDSELAAFDITNGKQNWRTDVRDPDEDDPVIAGGVSFSGGYLYVTNGYNEVLAIRPSDGKILWRAPVPSPSRAAPTIMEGRVFVTTLDNRLIALNAATGTILWEHAGITESAGLVGAASAAASRDIVVPAFSSGELVALRVGNGSVAWSDNLASLRSFGGLDSMSDIKAQPVIDKGMVIAISFSGRIAAIDERTGTRVWQREIGGSNTPWLAGNHLFVLSSDGDLVALSRETGIILWVTKLQRFEDEEDKEDPIIWTGPVLAGGRLILAGTDGRVVEINPENGSKIREWETEDTVAISPVVAGETLYFLTEDGTLSAYK